MAEQHEESTNPLPADSDTSIVSSQPETSSSIDDMSFDHFQKTKRAELNRYVNRYDNEMKPPEFSANKAWLYFASVVNPKAAYAFTRIAETMRGIQGPYNKNGNRCEWVLPPNPLTYIEDYQFYVEERWMDTLKDWRREILQESVYADPNRCGLEWMKLHSSRLEMQSHLEKLNEYLKVNCPNEEPEIDPTTAWRAIHRLLPKLEGLDSSICVCLGDMRIAWDKRKSATGQGESNSELRRRRIRKSPSRIVAENEDEPAVNSTSQESSRKPRFSGLFSWLEPHLLRHLKTFKSHVMQMSPRKRLLQSMVKQSTLWTISITSAAVSGIIIGMAVSKSRPAVCRPTPNTMLSDDGFWALLSQLVLNFLAVYCSVIPLLRHGDLSVRKSYFFGTAGISVSMCGLAPVLYGFSWEASALCSYVASVAALITGVQLAGGIQDRTNLPQHTGS
ncbi:hypothetical protein ACJZ2D_008405 [Fusarium nematophilum]